MEEVIGDRYELQDAIGRGGMATIYRAVDFRMGRTVAVKILREVYSSDPKFVTRFQREARAASALQHPNIVQVFDYGQSAEHYYIVMEFVDGADLRRYLKRTGVLTPERAIEIARDVALGLGAAHRRGIVHRDVKPQNILLNDEGLVKLTDFGIASMYKDAGAERLTTTGMTLGTVQYYAPEQAQGEVVNPAADVYALGIVLYEMLTGKTPFDGDTPVAVAMRHIQDIPEPPSAFNPRIPPALERLIMRCLEKDPRDRYKDGDALAYALENVGRAPARRGTGTVAAADGGRGRLMAPGGRSGPPARGGYDRSSGPSGPRGRGPVPVALGEYDGPLGGGPGTRPHGPAPRTAPRISGPNAWPRRQDEAPKRNGGVVAIVTTVAVLLLVGMCGLLVTMSGALGTVFKPSATPTPTVVLVQVPDYTGQQLTVAQADAPTHHLKLATNYVPDTRPKGTILDQDPKAGTRVRYDSTLTLSVSNGPAPITVPNVVGIDAGTACTTLGQAGLTCASSGFEQSATVGYGKVTRTDPKANTKIENPNADNTIVKIWVSSGPPPTNTPGTPTCTPATPPATPTC